MLPLILLLLLIGLLLLVVEAFVPGGIVSTIGVVLIIISGILFVQDYGRTAGMIYFAISAVVGFVVWLLGFLLIARSLALKPPSTAEPAAGGDPRIGAIGRVVQALRPTGTIELGHRRCAARTDASNTEVPEGARVVVTGVDSSYLVVEPIDSEEKSQKSV